MSTNILEQIDEISKEIIQEVHNLYVENSNISKNTRLIFTIKTKLTKEEIEKIIFHCQIEFFAIDTTNFLNVKEYFEMIDIIHDSCKRFNKNIGIIAILAGRKIKVESIKFSNLQSGKCGSYNLSKGQTIKVHSNTHNKKKSTLITDNSISVNFKELNKLVKINDCIIINDNKGSLKVLSIREATVKSKSNSNLNSVESIISYNRKHCFLGLDNSLKTYYDTDKLLLDKSKILKVPDKLVNKSLKITNDKSNSSLASKKSEISERDVYDQLYNEFDDNDILNDGCEMKIDNFLQRTGRKFTIAIDKKSEENQSRSGSPKSHNNKLALNVNNSDANISKALVFSNDKYIENAQVEIQTKRDRLFNNINKNIKTYEIICEVEYDCVMNKNSSLFVPNVDYSELGIDVLTKREVAEINYLDEHGVDFICINIQSMKDIESIREVNSNIKIIASLPDYTSLRNYNEILKNTSGIVLSRTFQILNEKTISSITRLTKTVISKCREFGRPIFSFIDVNDDFHNFKRKKRSIVNDIMYNIFDGMDGFLLNIINPNINDNYKNVDSIVNSLNYFNNYFKIVQSNHSFFNCIFDKGHNRGM